MLKLEDSAALCRSGIIPGVPIEKYHAHKSVSKSQLDQMAKSPAHYLASLTAIRKETPAMRIGSLFHGLVLEPDRVKIAVAPVCDRRTKDGKATWEAFISENQGAEVVSADEGEMLTGMLASVKTHPAASSLLSAPGTAEGSAWWVDQISGELCRCRPDFLRNDGIIVDLKTTDDASPAGFAKSIAKYGYHRQAAMYADGVAAATGLDVRGFVFVVVEKSAPYAVAVYQLDTQAVAIGREQYQENLFTLAECRRSGIWGGYSNRIETISLPGWATRGYDYE